ncbi:hypothetical protein TRFO_34192 [Tritrichomonas foetus]|uniref:Uncharacterized protein n=1 Tax=Tritrichomonas foetus TaxID=1144522 RepID=A0A1J4JJN5_9EUKA|nr:hypothetical protein TRFO_34192 [Tritrichomonas foetus]|eukprot:OHS99378.1 hypothetical protein TRFO_34192 [Tritrichomonas foetus]
MQAPTFDIIKKNLNEFDQNILSAWNDQLLLEAGSSLLNYVIDVPDFVAEPESLIAPEGALTLERISLDADPGEDVDMVITIETMKKKFGFPPTPCDRPQMSKPKKKKSKKKKSKGEHGKRAIGKTPRSESMSFPSKKK